MKVTGKKRSALIATALALVATAVVLAAVLGTRDGASSSKIKVDTAAVGDRPARPFPPKVVAVCPTALCGSNKLCCKTGEVCSLAQDVDATGVAVQDGLVGACLPSVEEPVVDPVETAARQKLTPLVPGGQAPARQVGVGQIPIPSAAFGALSASAINNLQINQYNNAFEQFTAGSSAQWTFNVATAETYSVSYYLAGLNAQSAITLGFVKGNNCGALSPASPGYAAVDPAFAGGYDQYQVYPGADMPLAAGPGQEYTLCVGSSSGMMLLSVCVHDDLTCHVGARPARTGILSDGGFEASSAWWSPACATQAQRVTTGAPGGPVKPRTGNYMYRVRALEQACSGIKQTLNAPVQGVTYHVTAWVWMPECPCTTDFKSDACPYMRFNADQTYDGIGTTHTATAGAWNAISGTLRDQTGQGVILSLENLPPGVDIYVDDIQIVRCTMDDFREYALPKIQELRMRDVQLSIGAREAEGLATVTMTRRLFPIGAATTGPELDNEQYQQFILQHFNGLTDEVHGKWKMQEIQQGEFTYANPDKVAQLARDNNMYYRGHGIFEEGSAMEWVKNLPTDGGPGSVQAAMWTRLNDYLDRYNDVITNFDVINEITHFNETFLTLPCYPDQPDSPCICWSEIACPPELGLARDTHLWTWAFAATRYLLEQRGTPNKVLYQNDFCYDHYCGSHNALSTMVKATKWVGNDGFGLQSHMGVGTRICGHDLMLLAEQATSAVPDTTMWLTEYDVNDPDLETRADGYESGILAAYASEYMSGIHLWGWAKETIAPTQDGRPYTPIVQSVEDMTLNPAGERLFGADGVLSKQLRSDSETMVPAEGEELSLRLYQGTYSLTVNGCTTAFQVPPGNTLLVVNPAKWDCEDGQQPPAATGTAGGANMLKKRRGLGSAQ